MANGIDWVYSGVLVPEAHVAALGSVANGSCCGQALETNMERCSQFVEGLRKPWSLTKSTSGDLC